jgi:hypothetical protein
MAPEGPHRIDALSLFPLFSAAKYQPATSRFPQKPWAADDHRCERTAWKLADPSLFSLFLTAQKSEKRLLERTGSARCFDEESAYLTARDHGWRVHTMRSCQKYEFRKTPGAHALSIRGSTLEKLGSARTISINCNNMNIDTFPGARAANLPAVFSALLSKVISQIGELTN